jgi:hypothetical protein
MAKPYPPILTTDTFNTWLTRTNSLLSDLSTVILTADTTTAGSLTNGNVHLTGNLDCNVLSVGSIRGGTNTLAAPLNIVSNANISGNLLVNGTTSLTSLALTGTLSSSGTTTLTGPTTISGSSLTVSSPSTFSSIITGSITGNAATATKLETARTIALAGDVSGTATFDGTSNITINAVSALNANTLLTQIKTIDGAGSGLDADLLDGLDSTKFIRNDQNASINGQLSVVSSRITDGANIWDFALNTGDLVISYNGTRVFRLSKTGNLTVIGNVTAYGTV